MIHFIGNNKLNWANGDDGWANIDQAVHYLEQCDVIAVDTETEGLDFTCKKMII